MDELIHSLNPGVKCDASLFLAKVWNAPQAPFPSCAPGSVASRPSCRKLWQTDQLSNPPTSHPTNRLEGPKHNFTSTNIVKKEQSRKSPLPFHCPPPRSKRTCFRLNKFVIERSFAPKFSLFELTFKTRELVIEENIRLVRLLDLTADLGVKTNANLTQIFQLREKSKTGI